MAEVAKKHGLSEQTLYVWRRRFGSMSVEDTRRLNSWRWRMVDSNAYSPTETSRLR
jgi:transposase-like protein